MANEDSELLRQAQGLRLLRSFFRIRDPAKRDSIIELTERLASTANSRPKLDIAKTPGDPGHPTESPG